MSGVRHYGSDNDWSVSIGDTLSPDTMLSLNIPSNVTTGFAHIEGTDRQGVKHALVHLLMPELDPPSIITKVSSINITTDEDTNMDIEMGKIISFEEASTIKDKLQQFQKCRKSIKSYFF